MAKKKITSGVIVTDGYSIVMGHSTGNKHWDIPKGVVNPGESYIDAAIRELNEETGINVSHDKLIFLGVAPYNKEKDLSLFLYYMNPLPDIGTLVCSSFVNKKDSNGNERSFPEFDLFKIVSWEKIVQYASTKLHERIMTEKAKVIGLIKK